MPVDRTTGSRLTPRQIRRAARKIALEKKRAQRQDAHDRRETAASSRTSLREQTLRGEITEEQMIARSRRANRPQGKVPSGRTRVMPGQGDSLRDVARAFVTLGTGIDPHEAYHENTITRAFNDTEGEKRERQAVRDWKAAGRPISGGLRSDAVVPWLPGRFSTPRPAAPSRDLSHLGNEKYRARTVKYGEHEAQFPQSQSRVTAKAQSIADRASEKLAPKVDRLRASESVTKRAAGKALTLPSARRRVPVQAGKHVAQDVRRKQATRSVDIETIKDVGSRRFLPGAKLEGEQAANFWYAQLPKSHRNPEGLKLVRAKIAEEHARLTTGEFGESVRGVMRSKRAEARAARSAGDEPAMWRAIKDIQDLRRIEADIPERLKNVGDEMGKLDTLIARPPKVREDAIGAVDELGSDTLDIYVRAGKIKPETAAERKGLVSRWVGLEPTGEEVYVGHRSGKVKGASPGLIPGGVSTGKTSVPANVVKQNRLHLVKTGRVRQELMPAVEDWQRAQKYELTNRTKDELPAMGEPVVGRPKPGYVLFNPRGHELPRRWKDPDDETRALAEGLDPDEVLVGDVDEYAKNVMATEPGEIEEMLRKATDAGHLKDLRQVPEDVVSRYFAQFMPARVTVATPGIKQGTTNLGRGLNTANDLLYLSLIYSNIGYIPAQVMGNTAMAVAHQGAFFPVNFARATQILTTGPQRLRDQLRAEHGMGATAVAASTRPIRAISGPIAGVADDAFRMSAVLHEAARMKVIPKNKPVLSDADFKALEEFVSNPQYRKALNDAADRATQSQVDFHRLGAKEAAIVKPASFVWTWIRGGSRYPIRFAADHPIRTAAIAGAAYAGQGEIRDRTADDMPPWLEGALNTGTVDVDGKTYPEIFPTRSFSPVSTPQETTATALGVRGARTVGELVNPGIRAVWNVANRQNPWGGEADSYGAALKSNLERAAPTVGFVRDVINPPDEPGMYPQDTSRIGRIKRQSRLFPIAVDRKKAMEARQREIGDVSPARRGFRAVHENRTEMFEQARTLLADDRDVFGEDGRLAKPVREAWNTRAAYKAHTARLEKKYDRDGVPMEERFKIAADLMVRNGKWTRAQADAEIKDTLAQDEAEIERRKNYLLRDELDGYILSYIGRAIRERGGAFELR